MFLLFAGLTLFSFRVLQREDDSLAWSVRSYSMLCLAVKMTTLLSSKMTCLNGYYKFIVSMCLICGALAIANLALRVSAFAFGLSQLSVFVSCVHGEMLSCSSDVKFLRGV